MIWAPPFNDFIWRPISCPPYTQSTFTPCIYFANFLISSADCIASSLVGERTIACVFLLCGSTFMRSGIPNDAVFPVPVCACPITSEPLSTAGIAWLCIGVASSNPISFIALIICGVRFNSSNFTVSIYFLPKTHMCVPLHNKRTLAI